MIWPRTRDTIGSDEISLMLMVNDAPFHCMSDGPTRNVSLARRSADAPRSVIVNRPPGP